MKRILVLVFMMCVPIAALSQSAFDKSLSEISSELSGKLKLINKNKIVVLYITDIDKQMTIAGKYLADIISVNLVNSPGSFLIFDRNNLNEIVEAKKLYAEGYIDVAKAQELKRILGVDVIIIGNYTVLSNNIKLTLKALDSENGFVVAACMKDLPLNADAGSLLGITITSENTQNINRGFNHPLNSDESYNNPNTVNSKCEEESIGDYCFQNNTKITLTIKLKVKNNGGYEKRYSCTLQPNQTQCFYDIFSGPGNYEIYDPVGRDRITYPRKPFYNTSGQIYVEKCKSKTFVIK